LREVLKHLAAIFHPLREYSSLVITSRRRKEERKTRSFARFPTPRRPLFHPSKEYSSLVRTSRRRKEERKTWSFARFPTPRRLIFHPSREYSCLVITSRRQKEERKTQSFARFSNVWWPSFSSIKPVLIVSNNMKRACSVTTDLVSERVLGFWHRADPVVCTGTQVVSTEEFAQEEKNKQELKGLAAIGKLLINKSFTKWCTIF
jgi:hypothetical protein